MKPIASARRRRFSALVLPAALVAGLIASTGCNSETKPVAQETAAASTEKKGIQWPELRALDEFAHEIELLAEEGRVADLRKLAPEVRAAAEKLAAAPVPADAPMRPLLEGMAKEIGTLGASLATAETMPDETLKATMEAMHPLVLKMMESAGMPHVHDHDEHDHDHGTHDHDDHGHEAHADDAKAAIEWPELKALDGYTVRVDELLRKGSNDELRAIVPELQGALDKFMAAPIPANAPKRDQLEALKRDVGGLRDMLEGADMLPADALKVTLAGVHPLVGRTMDTVGMTHDHGAKPVTGAGKKSGGSSGSSVAAEAPVHIPAGEEKARLHAAGDTDHEHEPGPNGGYVFHLSPAIHGELVIDPATGTATVHVLDIDEKATTLDDPMSAHLELVGTTNGGANVRLSLAPDNMARAYARFEAQDDALKGATSVAGRLTGKFRDSGVMAPVDRDVQWPPPPVAPAE